MLSYEIEKYLRSTPAAKIKDDMLKFHSRHDIERPLVEIGCATCRHRIVSRHMMPCIDCDDCREYWEEG